MKQDCPHDSTADPLTGIKLPISTIAAFLDGPGLAQLDNVLTDQWLAEARNEIQSFVAKKGSGDFDLTDPAEWDCPTIQALVRNADLETLMHELSQGIPKSAPDRDGYSTTVLRILDGTSGIHSRSLVWHYDAAAVTLVIPIIIPDRRGGELVVFANRRPHRKSALVNVAEKAIVQSRLWGRRVIWQFLGDPNRYAVPLQPGSFYFFRGYRTLHGTLPWPKGSLRVTLVLHYGYPYGSDNKVLRFAQNAQRQLRRKRPAAAYPDV